MTRTVRILLVLIGALLFAAGLLIGQQTHRVKYAKYLRPGTVAPMDLAMLRVNLEILREKMNMPEVLTVYYKSACGCFMARSVVTTGLMKQPLDEVRGKLLSSAIIARGAVEWEFPELAKWGTVPDPEFRMTFFELNDQDPAGGHDIAEYVNGKILFK